MVTMDVQFWLDTQIKLFPEAIFLDLIHTRNVGSQRVQRFVLPKQDPCSILSLALARASADARQHGPGPQIYALTLLNEAGEALSEFRHRLGEQDVGDAYDSERPTNEGVLKQMMRLVSTMHRDSRTNFKEAQAALFQEHTRLTARCEQLETRHQEVMTMQEELLSMRHQRELEAVRAMRAEGRKDKALSEVATLMPVVARKFLAGSSGSSANDAPTTPQDPLVSTLGASLSDDQIRALMGILSPAQQAAAYELFLKQRAKAAQTAEDSAQPAAAAH